MSGHVCSAPAGRAFCTTCGKVVDRDALQSIAVRPVEPGAKVTVDVHDTHKAEVTEHWNDNVDVTMKMGTAHFKGPDATPVTPGAKITQPAAVTGPNAEKV